MDEPEQYRPKITLYRCACRHCDAAEEELQELSARYGAVLEVMRADLDERLRAFSDWNTPFVAVDGVGVTQFRVDVRAWEEALRSSAKARPSSLLGSVVDLGCYFKLGSRPKAHETCARDAFAAGGPVGLATLDGRLFLALPDRGNPAAFESLKRQPGGKVRVQGEIRLRDGLAGVVVSRVDLA